MANLLAEHPELLPLAAAWVAEQEARILQNGTPLTESEMADAKAVGVQNPERIRVMTGPTMPMPVDPLLAHAAVETKLISPDTDGMAFRYGIFLLQQHRNSRYLVTHECVHTGQYERLGSIEAFLGTYLLQVDTMGYPEATMEQEAINSANDLVNLQSS